MSDYDELSALLASHRSDLNAAECHGFLCALICGTGTAPEHAIRDYALPDGDGTPRAAFCYTALKELTDKLRATLEAGDSELELLLAADDAVLSERVTSLAAWCRGFIAGVERAGLNVADCTEEVRELLEDFCRVARLDDDSVGETADEQDEAALMELIEYTRMGAIFMYEDLQRNDHSRDNTVKVVY